MQETPVPEIIALNASIRRPETRQTERGDQFQRDIRRRQPFRRINTNLQQTTDPGCEKCGLVSIAPTLTLAPLAMVQPSRNE